MIYSELKNYLQQITDPAVIALFEKARLVLEGFGFDDWLDVIENAVGDYSFAGDDAVLDAMRKRVGEMIDSILRSHGLQLVEVATLDQRLEIGQAILNLVSYEDKQALALELRSGESDQEIFASVVAVVSSLRIEEVLSLIDEVSDALILRLKQLILAPLQLQLEDVSLEQQRIKDYEKYKTVFSRDERWCDKFAQFSQAVGLPFASYAKLYEAQRMNTDFNDSADIEMAFRRVAINLIGIGCLSEEGVINTAQNAKPYLEKITADMQTLTQFYTKLTNLLLEYNSAQT